MAGLRFSLFGRRKLLLMAGALLPALVVSSGGPLAARAAADFGAPAAAAASTWTDIKAPLPANADHTFSQLNSVSCATTSSCTAVGSYTGSSGYQGLLLAKSGSAWTATQAPVPAGAAADPFANITAVTCLPGAVCAAVGSYTDGSGHIQGLLLTDSGSVWTAAEAPLPRGASASSVTLSAVRCPSATSCVAVGSYNDPSSPGNPVPLLVAGFGTTWTATPVPLPPNATVGAVLASVACPRSSACTAVGYYNNTSGYGGLIITGTGSSWTATQAPLPAGGGTYASLTVLRCPSASLCVAAGYYRPPTGGETGLLVSESGATWSATASPLPANAAMAPQAQLQMLTCPDATYCVASGSYQTPVDNAAGLIVTGFPSAWTAMEAPLPGNAARDQSTRLTGMACATGGCVIAADYQAASGYDTPALLLGSGSSWSAFQPPMPGNNVAYAYISAVACAKRASACVGAGSYTDRVGNDQALLLTGPP